MNKLLYNLLLVGLRQDRRLWVTFCRTTVLAPATSGHPEFDRRYRIQQNTLEQLLAFIPALWLFGWYAHALTAAGATHFEVKN